MMKLAGNTALVTFTKPEAIAATSYTMLYWFGVLVVAEYVRLADVVPLQTDEFVPRVIEGNGIIVIVFATEELTQPVVLFLTLIV